MTSTSAQNERSASANSRLIPGLTGVEAVAASGNAATASSSGRPPAFPVVRQLADISAMRFSISSGGTSSTWVATSQRWPKGSSNEPVRSP